MALLSASDTRRIEEIIAEIEKRSSAEFVVAVVPRSDRYDRSRAFVAAAWTIAAALVYFRFVPWGREAVGLLFEIPAFAAFWLLLGIPSLERLLVPGREAENAVHGAAFRMFAERAIDRTKGRTGILLFVSELERRAVLLGDVGIHERVGSDGWPRLVDHLILRIKEGRAADGIEEVLERLEGTLAERVPVEASDENELPNAVVRS